MASQASAYNETTTPIVAGLTAMMTGTAASIGTRPAAARACGDWSGVAVGEDNGKLAVHSVKAYVNGEPRAFPLSCRRPRSASALHAP